MNPIHEIRLIGYYSSENVKLNPENERMAEAAELAPLLQKSLASLEVILDLYLRREKVSLLLIIRQPKGLDLQMSVMQKMLLLQQIPSTKNGLYQEKKCP